MKSIAVILIALPLLFASDQARSQQSAVDTTRDTGPSFSPDGTRIGFSSTRDGDFDLYSVRPDGSDLRQLTDAPGDDHYVSWSPDGSKIAFISDRDGENRLYVMNADGTAPVAIATTKIVAAPSWSPDGSRIAFQKLVKGELPGPDNMRMPQPGELVTDVFTIRSDGSEETNITDSPAMDGAPVWTHDGEWIAFGSNRHNVNSMRSRLIYRMRPDGSEAEVLSEEAQGTPQSWSPDDEWLTFMSRMHGNPELYTVSRDGATVRRLTDNSVMDFYAMFAPDGRSIAFTRPVDGNQEVFVMDADGSNARRVTHN